MRTSIAQRSACRAVDSSATSHPWRQNPCKRIAGFRRALSQPIQSDCSLRHDSSTMIVVVVVVAIVVTMFVMLDHPLVTLVRTLCIELDLDATAGDIASRRWRQFDA